MGRAGGGNDPTGVWVGPAPPPGSPGADPQVQREGDGKAGGVGLRGGVDGNSAWPAPVPCPFCPHPHRLQSDKAGQHSLDPPLGHQAGTARLPLVHQAPHPGPRKDQGPPSTWSRSDQGASDHLLLGQWDPLTKPAAAWLRCCRESRGGGRGVHAATSCPRTRARAAPSAPFLTGSRSLGRPGRAGRWSVGSAGAFLCGGGGQLAGTLTGSPGTRPPGPYGSLGKDRAAGTWCWSQHS